MLTVFWGFMPAEIRASVRPLLVQYLWMLPTWPRRVYVRYSPTHEEGESVRAACSTMPEYRLVDITIYASWLHDSAADRRHSIVHELAHVPHAVLATEAERSVKTLLSEDEAPKFREYALENVRTAVETATEDWTQAILQLDPAHLPTLPFEEREDECPSMPEHLKAAS